MNFNIDKLLISKVRGAAIMNERKRTRVTGRIMYNGLANFYEITLNGLNSLMRLYDANAKLVMSRRMILPDNC